MRLVHKISYFVLIIFAGYVGSSDFGRDREFQIVRLEKKDVEAVEWASTATPADLRRQCENRFSIDALKAADKISSNELERTQRAKELKAQNEKNVKEATVQLAKKLCHVTCSLGQCQESALLNYMDGKMPEWEMRNQYEGTWFLYNVASSNARNSACYSGNEEKYKTTFLALLCNSKNELYEDEAEQAAMDIVRDKLYDVDTYLRFRGCETMQDTDWQKVGVIRHVATHFYKNQTFPRPVELLLPEDPKKKLYNLSQLWAVLNYENGQHKVFNSTCKQIMALYKEALSGKPTQDVSFTVAELRLGGQQNKDAEQVGRDVQKMRTGSTAFSTLGMVTVDQNGKEKDSLSQAQREEVIAYYKRCLFNFASVISDHEQRHAAAAQCAGIKVITHSDMYNTPVYGTKIFEDYYSAIMSGKPMREALDSVGRKDSKCKGIDFTRFPRESVQSLLKKCLRYN